MPKVKTPTIIHVNTHTVTKNRRNGSYEPPLAARHGRNGRAEYAHRIDILDSCGNIIASVIYRPDKPLKCGATVYIETEAVVVTHSNERVLNESSVRSGNGGTGTTRDFAESCKSK